MRATRNTNNNANPIQSNPFISLLGVNMTVVSRISLGIFFGAVESARADKQWPWPTEQEWMGCGSHLQLSGEKKHTHTHTHIYIHIYSNLNKHLASRCCERKDLPAFTLIFVHWSRRGTMISGSQVHFLLKAPMDHHGPPSISTVLDWFCFSLVSF